jgi:hypothetical protein
MNTRPFAHRPHFHGTVCWLMSLSLVAATHRSARGEPALELLIEGRKEMLQGEAKSTTIDTNGRISIAPQIRAIRTIAGRPTSAMIVSKDRKAIFLGSTEGRIYKISRQGASRTLHAKLKGNLVTAFAHHQGKLYAATSPQGGIYQIDETTGVAEPIVANAAEYIWALVSTGDQLLLATGLPGRIQKLTAPGKVETIFETDENHIRALAYDPAVGIVAGGGQKGIIYQIRNGRPFALYDAQLSEVTSVVVHPKRKEIYAALVSDNTLSRLIVERTVEPKHNATSSNVSPVKASQVIRINQQGDIDVLWNARGEAALALAFNERRDRLYVATGAAEGRNARIYEIETALRDQLRLLREIDASVASFLLRDSETDAMILGTPSGRVFELSSEPGQTGEYLTEPQDLARVSRIGRIWFRGSSLVASPGLQIQIRTGNTAEVDKTWSPFSVAVHSPEGEPVTVPNGRFVQFRALLTRAAKTGDQPAIETLHASLVRNNRQPVLHELLLLPRDIALESLPDEREREQTLTFNPSSLSEFKKREDSKPKLRIKQYVSPGMRTAILRATDENDDILEYQIEMLRTESNSDGWKLLLPFGSAPFATFDTRTYPEGRYQLRATVSDRLSNRPGEALEDRLASEHFIIDHSPPVLSNVQLRKIDNGNYELTCVVEDEFSPVSVVEYAVNGGPWRPLLAKDGLLDSRREDIQSIFPHSELTMGKQNSTLVVRAQDTSGNVSSRTAPGL